MLEHSADAKRFYNSAAWQQCRASYISKVFGMCERCPGVGYICDHIIEINSSNINDPDITLNHDNLQYLCVPCHNRKTFGGKCDPLREGLEFDSEGNLVEVQPIKAMVRELHQVSDVEWTRRYLSGETMPGSYEWQREQDKRRMYKR